MTSGGAGAAIATARAAYLNSFGDGVGYFDFARIGPLSRAVIDARSQATHQLFDPTPATIDTLMLAREASLVTAAGIAQLPWQNLAYVSNTSIGLFQIAFAISAAGVRDRVMIAADEFPANTYPWVRAHAAGRLEPVWLATGMGPVTAQVVAENLTERMAAVAVSAVDFRTGYRADLGAIRSVIGDRLLIVDGIQGFGAVSLEWSAADAVVVGGQKWLRSGWGTGFVAVSDRLAEHWQPLLAGWTAVSEAGKYDGRVHPTLPGAAALSITNLSPIDQAAFGAGLHLVESVGVEWIATRIADTIALLTEELRRIGVSVDHHRPRSSGSGILPVRVPRRDPALVRRALSEAGVSCTSHQDRIRLSVHATTTKESIAMVVEALRHVV